MEIPTIPEPVKEKIFTQMWVGQLSSATGFIMQKLGTDALEEYSDLIADQSAAQLRAMGVKSPVTLRSRRRSAVQTSSEAMSMSYQKQTGVSHWISRSAPT